MKEFDKLPKKSKIKVLWFALDYMQQYNGRSKEDCVKLAMEHKDDY